MAITLGGLILVPPFVSVFRTGKRMRLGRRVTGISGGSPGLFFLLSVIPIASIVAPDVPAIRAQQVVADPA